MELTAEVIKQYHLDILKCATLEEKQNMFLSQVRNNKDLQYYSIEKCGYG